MIFIDFETVKFIIKIYQNHDGTIVEFITYSKSIKFTMKKFAMYENNKCLLQRSTSESLCEKDCEVSCLFVYLSTITCTCRKKWEGSGVKKLNDFTGVKTT